jgi:5-methylcytosine-specific restriction endonuclease McrA
MTKIIWGINIPVQSEKIDWEATDKRREEIIKSGKEYHFGGFVTLPCIAIQREAFFELCEYCGNQVTGGRLKRGWKSCSKECNEKVNGAWRHNTLQKERELKGTRPTFFWWKIRDECFERDNYKCRECECDVREHIKRGFQPPEAHHIIPIAQGGSNKLENLKTLCYNCHKKEHSKDRNQERKHIPLQTWIE